MFRSYALAPLRCVALALLAVFGFVASLPLMTAIGAVVTYPAVLELVRRLTTVSRRLARAWGGVAVDQPYRVGPPPAPPRRHDGWYEHDGQLFKTQHYAAFFLRMKWLGDDPARARDWSWLLLLAPVGGLVVLLVPALVLAGVLLVAGSPARDAGRWTPPG
ncbi:hypothetical protein ACFQZ4_45485 [Catellatospora coxensis]